MTVDNCPKIVIFDDDHWPDGRVTGPGRILDEFKKRDLEPMVVHISHYSDLMRRVDDLKNSLFIMDSSIVNEGEKSVSFEQTIPFLLDSGVDAKRIMPASGGSEGINNNRYFEELMDRRGKMAGVNQMGLSNLGLDGDPKEVVDGILAYYEEVFRDLPEGCEHVAELSGGAKRYWDEKRGGSGAHIDGGKTNI